MITTPSMQELLEAGVHFGHQVRRGNPRMKQYIYGAREGVHIIDLAQSEKLLKEACEYVYNLGKEGKVLLFVGIKKQARPIVEEAAKLAGASYLIERWIGGFLTNFEEIGKRMKKMQDLKEQKEKGELAKYTKKEQLLIDREIAKLEGIFGGATELKTVPDAVYIVDTVAESTAVRECNRIGAKVVAIADTNSDPKLIDFLVPGNDDAIKSIQVITNAIAESYKAGKKDAGKTDKEIAQEKKLEKEAKKKDKKEEVVEEAAVDEELKEEVAAVEEEIEKKVVEDFERKV